MFPAPPTNEEAVDRDIQMKLTEQVTEQFVPIKDGTERLITVLAMAPYGLLLFLQKRQV